MNSWNTITDALVMSRFTAKERADLSAQQSDPDQLTQVLADVVDMVRGKIKAGGGRLGPDGTIPNSLKVDVISLAIWLWLSGFSKNEKLQTDGRKANYEQAIKVFDLVSSGKQSVELPDPGTIDSTAAPVNAIRVVGKTHRQFSRGKTRGL